MRDFASLQKEDWLQRRGAEVCLALGFSPALAWLRPFGVDERTFFARLGYWCGLLVCWFMMMAAVEMLLTERRFFQNLSPLARRVLVIGLAAFPMIIVVGAATNALTGWEASLEEVVELYWQIVMIGSIVTLLAKAVLPVSTKAEPAMIEAQCQEIIPLAPPEVLSPLALRLPLEVRGRILCLEMEDHYVRVHTDRGSALVLLRLSDAISEVQPVQGRQVHRSWWVSDAAVESFERNGRTGALRLSNGARAPVSQRYLRSVEDSFA